MKKVKFEIEIEFPDDMEEFIDDTIIEFDDAQLMWIKGTTKSVKYVVEGLGDC